MSGRASRAAAAALVLCAAIPTGTTAQVVNHAALEDGRRNLLHLRTGVEYGFIAGVGYGRVVGVGGRTLLLSGTVASPWARADASDYRVRIGAASRIVGQGRWRLIGGLGASLRGTENTLSRLTSVGTDAGVLGGVWSRRWFLAGEAAYDGAIATHIEHSAHYRDVYYDDARDGWYVDTGANINVGLAGGVSVGRYGLVLRAGHARDRGGRAQLYPAYATLDLNVRF